jgi:hypothetical protein
VAAATPWVAILAMAAAAELTGARSMAAIAAWAADAPSRCVRPCVVGQWFRPGLQTALQSRHRTDQWQSSHGVSCPDAGAALRRDEAGEEVRLASLDERSLALLVPTERGTMVALRAREFSGEPVCADHAQHGAAAGYRGGAVGGVTDQGHPTR